MKIEQNQTTWLNRKRIQNYPRLFLVGIWVVLLINLVFHRGWLGYFGGLIGLDYVSHYTGGLLYRTAPDKLYDLAAQMSTIQQLFSPTHFADNELITTFPYPPFVAMVFSLETYLPVTWALGVRMVFSIISGFLSTWLLKKYLIPDRLQSNLGFGQLGILLFSFFPFVMGLFWGQNHVLTFLLITGICVSITKKRWFLAGILAGLLFYKPYFLVGFLLLWLVERNWRSLASFFVTSSLWVSLDVIITGNFDSYIRFVQFSLRDQTPYFPVFNYETTLFEFLNSIFSTITKVSSGYLFIVWMAGSSIILLVVFYKLRADNQIGYPILVAFAIIAPYIISYHIWMYDLLPLIIALLFLAHRFYKKQLLYLAISVYFLPVILLAISYFGKFAWLSLIPLSLCGFVFYEIKILHNEL